GRGPEPGRPRRRDAAHGRRRGRRPGGREEAGPGRVGGERGEPPGPDRAQPGPRAAAHRGGRVPPTPGGQGRRGAGARSLTPSPGAAAEGGTRMVDGGTEEHVIQRALEEGLLTSEEVEEQTRELGE